MTRLVSTMGLDAKIQLRNRFYVVGIAMAVLLGVGVRQFFDHEALETVIPILFLFAIGGTTLLYVAGLVIFEKDQGTLAAITITPLPVREYIASKVITLTALAALESGVSLALSYGLSGFNPALMVSGVVVMGVIMTLMGFVMIVRYDTITDFLIPVLVVALVLQLPFIHFVGIYESIIWYIIPTTAPTMLIWGAWHPLETWELIYALVYSVVQIVVLYRWALSSFRKYIILKERK